MVKELSKINIGHSEIFMRSDGITQVNATDHLYLVEDINKIHQAVQEINFGKDALLLLVASGYTLIDTDARKFLGTPEAGLYFTAKAYIIQSLAQRLLMNFISKVMSPPVPVRFFTKEEQAVQWLLSQK